MAVWRNPNRADGPGEPTKPLTIEYRGGECATIHLGNGVRTTVPVARDGERRMRTRTHVLATAYLKKAQRVDMFEAPARRVPGTRRSENATDETPLHVRTDV